MRFGAASVVPSQSTGVGSTVVLPLVVEVPALVEVESVPPVVVVVTVLSARGAVP